MVSRETSPIREAIKAALDEHRTVRFLSLADEDGLIDQLVEAVERVPVVPALPGNGSMDGVTPILFFEAGSPVTHELRSALTWANVNHVRITIDDGRLKWKVAEGVWTPGYPSERENGGNGE